MDFMLKFARWNVRGLSQKKVQENEFFNIVNKLVMLCLVETWTHKESPFEIPGFCNFHVPGKKIKKRGRRSGGIIIFYKDHLQKGISLENVSDNIVWFKLDSKLFNLGKTFIPCFSIYTTKQRFCY